MAVLTQNTEIPGNPYVSTMVEPALEACAGVLTDESYAVAAERGRGLDLELTTAMALLRARDLLEARAS